MATDRTAHEAPTPPERTRKQTLARRRPGRPAQTIHGTIAGVNLITGESVGWSDGQWSGSKRLVTVHR